MELQAELDLLKALSEICVSMINMHELMESSNLLLTGVMRLFTFPSYSQSSLVISLVHLLANISVLKVSIFIWFWAELSNVFTGQIGV